ncbi:hypothetical protein [Alteromonas hispanica]|uniref:Uncharacterized protein n=1 Tax=Alteromonas hispanica TaxID=315421 RepID=A0A6L9MRU0_9ALTE|nr:hypothetical protein [Alteromonas hispanica]NDW20643.1 hypothetical protein [Alteromonas hispanica]
MSIQKVSELNHTHTSPFIRALNLKLVETLHEDSSNYEKIERLVALRHFLVIRQLKRLGEAEQKLFAEKELRINDDLVKLMTDLLENAKEDLVEFKRSHRAVKRYKE